jgi:hypothetical protein
MSDVIRHHQSVTLTAGASTSTSPSSSPGPPVVVATPPAVEQRVIAGRPAAAAAAVGDNIDVRLRIIVVLVVPAIPPPSPQSRVSTAPPSRDDLPPLLVLRDVEENAVGSSPCPHQTEIGHQIHRDSVDDRIDGGHVSVAIGYTLNCKGHRELAV